MLVFPSDRRNVTIWTAFSCLNYIYGSNSKCGSMLYSRECRNSHIHSVLPGAPTLQLVQKLFRSWEAVCMWGLLMVWVGFQEQTWGFTDCKKNKYGPKQCTERPGRSCLLVPRSKVFWRIVPNRERDSLMTRLILLLVTRRKHLLKEFLSSSHTLFQHTVQPDIFLLIKSSFFQVTTWIWAVPSAGLCP